MDLLMHFYIKLLEIIMVTFSDFWNCMENEPIDKPKQPNGLFLVLTKYGKTNLNQIGVRKSHPGLKCSCQIATSYYFYWQRK